MKAFAAATRCSPIRFLLFCLCGLWASALRTVRTENLSKGTGLIDMYWVNFYLVNFRDGFHKRAILGSITRLLEPAGASLLCINLFAFLVLFCLIFLVGRQILSANSGTLSTAHAAVAAIVFAGGITGVLFQTAGDPMQVCMLVAVAAFVLMQRSQSTGVRLAIAIAACGLNAGIHEASVFLIAPALLLAALYRVRAVMRLGIMAVIVAVLLGGVTRLTNANGNSTYTGIGVHVQRTIHLEPDVTPPLGELLRQEIHERTKDSADIRFTEYMIAGLGMTYLAGMVLFCWLLPEGVAARMAMLCGITLVISAPLYIIAHDWGRWSTYTLLISLFAAMSIFRSPEQPTGFTVRSGAGISRLIGRVKSNYFVLAFAVLAVILSIQPRYIEEVMPTKITKSLLPLCIAAVLMLVLKDRNASAQWERPEAE
ncbi:hypothetical protein [Silvibacterium acidisoli]|uniref:hypothetical protein n=1 Tax=Acidobacteriaceae bacterium ZG23-2 TaxID=2883246 RepID=UPI00406D1CC6